MPTRVETVIRRKRKTERGILVPMIEDFMERPVEIEGPEDVNFLTNLVMKISRREYARKNDLSVFSPSMLGSCLRHVYLKRHGERLGIIRQVPVLAEPNYYFLTGNFLHLKWQFALYKMEKRINDPKVFRVYDFELPVLSKRKDHGGTMDALAFIREEPFILDFKGLNVGRAQKIMRGEIPGEYAIQLADYMILWNAQRKLQFRVERSLLLVENKGGPDPKHPLALSESEIKLKDYKTMVNARLEVLRAHEEKDDIPRAECVSTGQFQFQSCPYSGYCHKEVEIIQRRRKALDDQHAAKASVAVARPSGNSRSRRTARR